MAAGNVMTHSHRWLAIALTLGLVGCPSVTERLPNLSQHFPNNAASQPTQPSPAQTPAIAEMETRVRQQINKIREEHGLQPLELNERLAGVARDYSRQMAQHDFFSHTGVDGKQVGERARAAGIAYWVVGENLFKSTNAPQPVPLSIEGWMNSPGHRDNILHADYRETGVGIWRDGNTYYFTQLFLRSPHLPDWFGRRSPKSEASKSER